MSTAETAPPRAPVYRVFERPFEFAFLSRLYLVLITLGARWTVEGRDLVPRSGPLLVTPNHLHYMDPALVGAVMPRPTYFMAKDELFRKWFGRWIVTSYRAFPVRRGASDRQSLRMTLDLLEQGKAVVVFPEGHRSHGEGLLQAHPGVGLIALKSGAQVLPMAITGTETVLPLHRPRPRVSVRFGEPYHLEPGRFTGPERAQEAADEMMRKLAELLPPQYRGRYGAPQPDPTAQPG